MSVEPPGGTKFKIILKIGVVSFPPGTPTPLYVQCKSISGAVIQTPRFEESGKISAEPVLLCKESLSFSHSLQPLSISIIQEPSGTEIGKTQLPLVSYLIGVESGGKANFPHLVTFSKNITAQLVLSVARDKDRPPALALPQKDSLEAPKDEEKKTTPRKKLTDKKRDSPRRNIDSLPGNPTVDKLKSKTGSKMSLSNSSISGEKNKSSRSGSEDSERVVAAAATRNKKSSRLTDLLGNSPVAARPTKTADDSSLSRGENPFPGLNRAPKYKTIDAIVGQHDAIHQDSHFSRSQGHESSINEFKAKYLRERKVTDQDFVVDVLLKTDVRPYDQYSMGYILYHSLMFWQVFTEQDTTFISKLLASYQSVIKESEESQKSLFFWGENLTYLSYEFLNHAREEKIDEKFQKIFIEQVTSSISLTFKSMLPSHKEQQLLKESFTHALNSGSVSAILSLFDKKYKLWIDHSFFKNNRKYFWSCLFHYITVAILDSLTGQVVTMTEGLKLKMILGQVQQWSSGIGEEIVPICNAALRPCIESANILCLGSKADLIEEHVRNDVWPTLDPKFVVKLLKLYKTEASEKIPLSLFNHLQLLSKAKKPVIGFFDPNVLPVYSLIGEDGDISLPDLSVQVPKVVLERPGFQFLKTL